MFPSGINRFWTDNNRLIYKTQKLMHAYYTYVFLFQKYNSTYYDYTQLNSRKRVQDRIFEYIVVLLFMYFFRFFAKPINNTYIRIRIRYVREVDPYTMEMTELFQYNFFKQLKDRFVNINFGSGFNIVNIYNVIWNRVGLGTVNS